MIVGICLALMAFCLFGTGGFRHLIGSWIDRHRTSHLLKQLRAEHEALSRELNRLQQDPSYTDYLIRKNLGYIKKGEVEYRFVKKDNR